MPSFEGISHLNSTIFDPTYLWYMPDGSLYSYGTETLYELDNLEESTYLWLYISFADIDKVHQQRHRTEAAEAH